MDYVGQQRLKILGRTKILEGNEEAQELIAKLRTSERNAFTERAFVIRIEAFDWNCPQHITPRFTEEEVRDILEMRNT
jgi:predicted pyridoxine 5'-phosphate oxidase superfamily flavin-nucleotide-binding protein